MKVTEYLNAIEYSLRPRESMHPKSLESYVVDEGVYVVFGTPKSKYRDKTAVKLVEVVFEKSYFEDDMDPIDAYFASTDFRYCIPKEDKNRKYPLIRTVAEGYSPSFGNVMILLCERGPLYDTLLNQMHEMHEDALNDYMSTKEEILSLEDAMKTLSKKKKSGGAFQVVSYNSYDWKTEYNRFHTEKEAEEFIKKDKAKFAELIDDARVSPFLLSFETTAIHVSNEDETECYDKVWEKAWNLEEPDAIEKATKLFRREFVGQTEEQIIRFFLKILSSVGADIEELASNLQENSDTAPKKDNILEFPPTTE